MYTEKFEPWELPWQLESDEHEEHRREVMTAYIRGFADEGYSVPDIITDRYNIYVEPERFTRIMDETPAMLRIFGVPDHPWVQDSDHLVREVRKKDGRDDYDSHGIPLDILNDLGGFMAGPVAAYADAGHPGTFTVVLDAADAYNEPIIVCCMADIRMRDADGTWRLLNRVLSIHPRHNLSRDIDAAARNELLMFADVKGIQHLFSFAKFEVPTSVVRSGTVRRGLGEVVGKAKQIAAARETLAENEAGTSGTCIGTDMRHYGKGTSTLGNDAMRRAFERAYARDKAAGKNVAAKVMGTGSVPVVSLV